MGGEQGSPTTGNERIAERLAYLRGCIEAENISYGEIAELQSLAEHIDPSDVLLLQWAGVPEFTERFIVTFSANLHVSVDAKDEDDARDKATEIANIQAAQYDTVVQEIDWIVIHTDDIVSVGYEERDPYEVYGTPEHESWLIEMERQEG